MRLPRAPWLILLALATFTCPSAHAGEWRIPVRLAWDDQGNLGVLTRDGARFFLVRPEVTSIRSSHPLPAPGHSLAWSAEGRNWLAGTDDGQLLILSPEGQVVQARRVGRGPVEVLPWSNRRALVACRWDRSVLLLDPRTGEVLASHALTFAPGVMAAAPGGRVVVADAFGSHLVCLRPGEPGSIRGGRLDGVGLRAISVSARTKEVLVGHMDQYGTTPITATNIDWGLVLSSRLSVLDLAELEAEGPLDRILARRRLILDGSKNGAADPAALAVSADENLVLIACGGSGKVLLNDRRLGESDSTGRPPIGTSERLESIEAGRRPVAIALDPRGKTVVVADASEGNLAILDLATRRRVATLSLQEPGARPDPRQRGEAAFHDGRLSLDRWMSCASCHVDGHTNALSFDTLGDGDYGAPKNTPSLLGVGATSPYTWTGHVAALSEQVQKSFDTSLRGSEASVEMVEDVTEYLRSLSPPPARVPRDDPQAARGRILFKKRGCVECHVPPLYTSRGRRDGGIRGAEGHPSRYNPPSLRGVGWSAPYFHDGRTATLSDVLQIHPNEPDPAYSASESADLIRFLESL